MEININLMRSNVAVPHFSETDQSIVVFYANLENEEALLMPGTVTPIPLGIALDIEPGYLPLIRLTNELKMKGITHAVTYGKNKEIILMLRNVSPSAIKIEDGENVALGIFVNTATSQNSTINIINS